MEMTRVAAIKEFFDMTGSEAMKEIKALTPEERVWFGDECASALGVTIKEPVK